MKLEWDCIRFTQTVGWEARDSQKERLADYDGLVAWCLERGIVSGEYAEAALAQAHKRPEQARVALEDARTLRLSIYRILSAVGTGRDPDPARIEELNAYLQRGLPSRLLTASSEGAEWTWQLDPFRLDHVLGPIAWSAAKLLTSPEAQRLSLCAADDCGWLFVDGSRNRSRRWCDMSDCGNRAKVQRFRSRQRKGTERQDEEP
jgi:predicted RNA-binding Zn ribbon-like protein